MGDLYKNTGAPFTREDGSTVATNDLFEPTKQELAQRAYKLRAWEPKGSAPVLRKPVRRSVPTVRRTPRPTEQKAKDDWPLKMKPGTYLKLHPSGPHAARARKILGLDGDSD